MTTNGESAADRYAARVDIVLAQRTRLRGPQPPGDKRAGCPTDHPLVKADPLRRLDPNLAIIASYIEADDVIIDVGGGAGRISLPLALRCREVINVEPSTIMANGFRTNAAGRGKASALRSCRAPWRPAAGRDRQRHSRRDRSGSERRSRRPRYCYGFAGPASSNAAAGWRVRFQRVDATIDDL